MGSEAVQETPQDKLVGLEEAHAYCRFQTRREEAERELIKAQAEVLQRKRNVMMIEVGRCTDRLGDFARTMTRLTERIRLHEETHGEASA